MCLSVCCISSVCRFVLILVFVFQLAIILRFLTLWGVPFEFNRLQ